MVSDAGHTLKRFFTMIAVLSSIEHVRQQGRAGHMLQVAVFEDSEPHDTMLSECFDFGVIGRKVGALLSGEGQQPL